MQRVDNFIQRINPYPADKIGAFLTLIGQRANFIRWIGIYLLSKVIHSSYNRVQGFKVEFYSIIEEYRRVKFTIKLFVVSQL